VAGVDNAIRQAAFILARIREALTERIICARRKPVEGGFPGLP